ncbi:hypothetical protein TKK_0005650 [Trichogramma kaykai]|uniref:peptidylprolyl isomerase n=1 Tax=Trichogramma kaykai TaxID=54128 RepID=A0ABD2XHL8_9HYME
MVTCTDPLVFLDFAVNDEKIGRVVISLFKDKCPLAAENFRALCTGEKGIGTKGKPLHYKGSQIHKYIPQLMLIGGDIIDFNGNSGESIYGSDFEDEDLKTMHDTEGFISMVNRGVPNSNNSQFVITLNSCPQLDGNNVICGVVRAGLKVLKDIGESTNICDDKPMDKIVIVDCGELGAGENWGLDDNDGVDKYVTYPEDWNIVNSNKLEYEKILNIIKEIKGFGNAFFVKMNYVKAEKKYKKALRYYEYMNNMEEFVENENNEEIKELKCILLLNLATVKLYQKQYKEAHKLSTDVIMLDPNNYKGFLRRGQAYVGLGEYEKGLEDFQKANEINSLDEHVLKEVEKAKNLIKSYKSSEKDLYKRMFK